MGSTVCPLAISSGWYEENGGKNEMEKLTQRVERLEEDTHQIKLDLAVLTARSENFATKADLAELKTELKDDIAGLRTDQYEMRVELLREIAASEARANGKFERLDTKIGDINNRITWTLLIPALTAIILWFVKTAVLKI